MHKPMMANCQSAKIHDRSIGLSPEERLLVLAARRALCPEDGNEMTEILSEGLDWSWLEGSGKRLGVQPFMLKHFSRKENVCHVPAAVMVELREACRLQSIRSFRNYSQISRLLVVLNREKIPVILLKGAYLAEWAYEDRTLRPMSDIDILVPESHAAGVQENLLGCGYEQMQRYDQSLFHREVAHIGASHLPPLLMPTGVHVEVHLNLFNKVPIKTDAMAQVWNRATPIDLYGASALALCPEHLILHLALHLHHHMMGGNTTLYWFCDLDLVVRRCGEGIRWDEIKIAAEAMGIASRIATIFHVMAQYWGTPIPKFMRDLHPGAHLDLSLRGALFQSKINLRNFFPNRLQLVREIQEKYGWGKGLYYTLRHLVPVRSYILNRYDPQNRREIYGCYIRHFFDRFRFVFSSLFVMVRNKLNQ
jgi:hypothetical protein